MTPRPGRRAAIVGVAESDVGATPHLTVLSQQALAAQAALREAGLAKDTVDAVLTAGAWSWAPTMTLAEYLGIQPRYTDSTNIGGSSCATLMRTVSCMAKATGCRHWSWTATAIIW